MYLVLLAEFGGKGDSQEDRFDPRHLLMKEQVSNEGTKANDMR